uniref:Uncharacterized protein n=1 Tax=Solanum tuberosum TaxID=4113 RepID=M1BEB2_SOLTU
MVVDEPKDWCCQKCNIDKGVISLSRGLENKNSNGSMSHASAKICQSTLPPKKRLKSLELRSLDVMKASRMMNPLMTNSCDPALVHSWKGSFDILSTLEFVPGMLNNCIQVHPPSKVKRWNNEHFLWGLFYHMGQDKDGYAEEDNNKVIDMEVDMIAGENIGTMDIVVSKVIDMEVDMEAGENVGTLDIVVSKVIDMEVDMIA